MNLRLLYCKYLTQSTYLNFLAKTRSSARVLRDAAEQNKILRSSTIQFRYVLREKDSLSVKNAIFYKNLLLIKII